MTVTVSCGCRIPNHLILVNKDKPKDQNPAIALDVYGTVILHCRPWTQSVQENDG